MFEFFLKTALSFTIFYAISITFNICPCDNRFNDFVIDKVYMLEDELNQSKDERGFKGVGSRFILKHFFNSKDQKSLVKPDPKDQALKDKIQQLIELKKQLENVNSEEN